MPRKAKKSAKPATRRITINVEIEGDLDEDMIPLVLEEFPSVLDELRGGNKKRQLLALWAVVHDGQDPIAEYQYFQNSDGNDVREVHVADSARLAVLGYKL